MAGMSSGAVGPRIEAISSLSGPSDPTIHRVPLPSRCPRRVRSSPNSGHGAASQRNDAMGQEWTHALQQDNISIRSPHRRAGARMHLITKFFTGALLSPPISLRAKPRAFASETHRLKLSLSDSLASARDVLAASVFFFWANTAVDVTTLIASAAVAVAKISRIVFSPCWCNEPMR